MNATYTAADIATFADAIKTAIKDQLTVGQRMEFGTFDAEALAKETLDFLAKDYSSIEDLEAAAATASKQFRQLIEFDIITLTVSN